MTSPAKKKAEPRAHHFAPQCWLAGFTDTGRKDGHLFVTDLKRRKQWPSTPPNVGHRRDFYRISDSQMEPVAFEKVFSRIEDFIAPTLKALYEKPQYPTLEQLDKLLYFAAVQFIRVPAFRPTLLKISDSIHRSAISKALKSKESWEALLKDAGIPLDSPGTDYERMLAYEREVIDTGQYSLSAENEFFLLRGFDAVEKPILPSLRARHWTAIVNGGGTFIGSDNPVMLDGKKGTVGFKSATVIIFIVNRYLLLCGTDHRMKRSGGNRKLLAFHNSFTMLSADEQLYSHTPDFYWLNEQEEVCTDWKLFSKDKLIESIKP
ncbi:MAG: DUF4238 domain-containing protein [Terriglobales bacterium]